MANELPRLSRALRRLTPAAALLLGACATADIQKPIGRAGRLGASLCPSDGGLTASSIVPGGPADKARLRDGDLLVDYGDADLSKETVRKSLLWDLRAGAGKTLRLTVERDGKPVRLKLVPEVKDVYPKDELYAVLADEIMTGRKVSVAVVVTGINHTKPEFFSDAQGLEAWKTGMGNSLKNNFENLLLNKAFLHCGNYSVADRDATDRVLKELNFQMTGAVSAETAKQVGKMTGASHLLFVDFTRFLQPSGDYEDDSSVRLVTVESDSVLASVRFRQHVDPR
jgi:hypothetical protein